MSKLRDGVTNAEILNAIRADARLDYQRIVPEATKANIEETIGTIMNHEWARNQFVDALFNQIGSTIVRDITWHNPLAIFKQGMLEFGDTIQEVHADLIAPTVYNSDRDYLEKDVFGQSRAPVYSAFHTINRQEKFKITVNNDIMRRAFLSQDGLSSMLSQIMAVPASSDEWAEFLTITSLFRTYEKEHGFFRVQIPEMNVFEPDKIKTDAALKAMRAYADKMRYPTPAFNASHVHSFARPDNLVLIATPEFKANVDVTSLSAAFNRSDADAPSHIITIPNEALGLTDISAILTTREFLVIKDTLLTNRSIQNPAGLYDNYFLHHHSILSCSPFTPAIAFGTRETTRIELAAAQPAEIEGFKIADQDGKHNLTPKAGDLRDCSIVWKTPLTDDYRPSIDWDIAGNKSRKTVISNDGVLVVGNDEPKGTVITIKVTVSNYPGNTDPIVKTTEVTVS